MKHLSKISLLMGLLVVAACEDQLNVVPQGTPTSTNFWKTEADAVAGANAIYSEYNNDDMYGRGFFWLNNASDDIGTKPRDNAEKIKNFQVNGGESETKNIWALHYQVMKRCDDVIRNVPDITMDEALKNRVLGEAYFNHAVMHLELAYRYGDSRAGIPIVDRVAYDNPYVPRPASVQVNYDYITADLLKAADLLPYFDSYDKSDYGRAHKTAAWAYLARTYLYAKDWANAEKYADMVVSSGKHGLLENFADVFTIANNWSIEYIWSVTSSAKDWANAEKYADMVVSSGKHGLLENFADVFTIANNWSIEYIWSVTSSAKDTGLGSIFPGVCLEDKGWGLYNGWGNFYPTKELFDTYEAGDERLSATILKKGDKFTYFGEERTFDVDAFTVSSSNRTGFQFKKYMEPWTYAKIDGSVDTRYVNSNGDKPSTALNLPLIRYADVLLMKAEARLMQNKNADTEINAIRERAGLTAITNATMTDLKRERRCELAGEWTDRHFDLIRWGDAQQVYAQPLHHADGHVIYESRNFNPNIHHVWPIPPDEIAVSRGTLSQNEGW